MTADAVLRPSHHHQDATVSRALVHDSDQSIPTTPEYNALVGRLGRVQSC